VHRGTIGIQVQGITAALAAGLGLSRASGVVVSDVVPGSPADVAGVQVQDIVLEVDGTSVPNVLGLVLPLYSKSPAMR
jgi:serine protease Do